MKVRAMSLFVLERVIVGAIVGGKGKGERFTGRPTPIVGALRRCLMLFDIAARHICN